MGTTNKLLQTALQKRMHSSRQPEAAVVTYRHTAGENDHDYQIVPEVLFQQ